MVAAAKYVEQTGLFDWIDINCGCPVRKVVSRGAGAALLKELPLMGEIIEKVKQAVSLPVSVKTRIGFDDPRVFEELLPIFARHSLDLLTVHARTVKEMYRSEVHYDFIARAVAHMPCPVVANGNVHSAGKAAEAVGFEPFGVERWEGGGHGFRQMRVVRCGGV